MKRNVSTMVAVAVVVLGTSLAGAQNTAGQAGQLGQQQGQATLSDQQIAACLLVGNRGEVALGQFAQDRAKHDDVKDAAKMMVTDHSKFIQELNRFAGRWADGQNLTSAGQPPQVQTGQFQAGQPMAGQGGLDFVAVHQQIGEQCVESAKREFSEKQGAEFDKCYVGQQIGAHMEMLVKLKVLQQHASPQLAQVLAEGEQTTQKHLDHLKHIMKELESQPRS